jgi:NAD kinase
MLSLNEITIDDETRKIIIKIKIFSRKFFIFQLIGIGVISNF